MYYVYLIKSKKEVGQHYVGYTTDLKQRIKDHNSGKSVYTNKFRPWVLLCYFAFQDKKIALNFESYLKSGSGKVFPQKHFLISK